MSHLDRSLYKKFKATGRENFFVDIKCLIYITLRNLCRYFINIKLNKELIKLVPSKALTSFPCSSI